MANGKDFAQEAADRLNDLHEDMGFNRVWVALDYGRHPEITAYADLLAELSARDKDLAEIAREAAFTDPGCRTTVQIMADIHAIAAKYAPKPDPLVEAMKATGCEVILCNERGADLLRAELAKRGLELRSVQGGE